MAKEPVRIAAVAAAAGFLVQAAFQAAIALGRASWGGAYDGQLPMGLRIASGVTAGVYVLAALIVLGRGGVRGLPLPYGVLRWGTWVLAGLLFVGGAPELRVVERMGALRMGTLGADPGSPVPLRRA
jgi:hypothetical protein